MMGRSLSIFLALLAIFIDAEAKAPKNKVCTIIMNEIENGDPFMFLFF